MAEARKTCLLCAEVIEATQEGDVVTQTSEQAAVTFAKDAIHNPAEPRHFMRLKPVKGIVRVRRGDQLLAESRNAIHVLEVGRDFYDPVLYIPDADLCVDLERQDKSTHCPLKGDASYFALMGDNEPIIAWRYEAPLNFADGLKDRIAFYASHVTTEIAPA